MVKIELFGKKWKFDNETVKYVGCGLALFYLLRIVKFCVQKLIANNTAPIKAPMQPQQKLTKSPVAATPITEDSGDTDAEAEAEADAAAAAEAAATIPSEKDKKTN